MSIPYVVYLNWREFCAGLPARGTVQVQVVCTTQSGTFPILQPALWLTAAGTGQLHALRLPIETADMLLPTPEAQHERRRRMQERADLARVCAERALPPGLDVAAGLLLVPGLYDDLARIEGSADLWQWTGDHRDPEQRVLAPAPALQAAVAQYQRDSAGWDAESCYPE